MLLNGFSIFIKNEDSVIYTHRGPHPKSFSPREKDFESGSLSFWERAGVRASANNGETVYLIFRSSAAKKALTLKPMQSFI